MKDTFKREINYMRISVTDRCNLRCRYCMPFGIHSVSMSEILTFEEISLVAKAAVSLGITRFRVTGGEPLARLGTPALIKMLKSIPGVTSVTMTTNGVLIGKYLEELIENGLDAVNISLDTLDAKRYMAITGFDTFDEVWLSITHAVESPLSVKINAIPMEINRGELADMAHLAQDMPLDVRFIEMMPIGHGKDFFAVGNAALMKLLRGRYPDIKRDESVHGSGPAVYYHIPGWKGSIGFISPLHEKFCAGCNRLRLTATGQIKPCLCYSDRVDIRKVLRETPESRMEEALRETIANAVASKPAAHHFEQKELVSEEEPMSGIGG